ncbi:hypothetical protein EON82_08485 [bacterium]|nr:MAG: hypothetical protein EON82_08485 [bacterium]
MSEPKSVFSEKEASEVLQRAARLQEEGGGASSYAPGISRDELVRIATEAGISPDNLEAAIRAASQNPAKRSFLNLVEEVERVVDAELEPDDFDVLLDVAKPARTRRSPARQVGRTFTMQTNYRGSLYNVEVTSRNGRTRIRVSSMPLLAYLLSLHPALMISIIGTANMAAHGGGAAAALFGTLTMLVGALGFVGLARRGSNNTAELADKLEQRVREATEPKLQNLGARTGLRFSLT